MDNHAREQYVATHPTTVAQVTRYDEIDIMDDHWSDTEVVIIVVFVVLATVAVTRLLGKKKDAQHE
jgi:hypothetical protein